MSNRISKAKEDEAVRLLQAGRRQREIAEALGISKTAVARLASTAGQRRKPSQPAKAAPPPTVQSAMRETLVKALHDADAAADDVRVAKARLALYRHDDPAFARTLRDGGSLVSALIEHGDELLLIRDPKDIAALAQAVTEEPGYGWEQEEDESDKAFAAFLVGRGEAEKQRAIDLLAGALEIVKAAPLAERWRRRS